MFAIPKLADLLEAATRPKLEEHGQVGRGTSVIGMYRYAPPSYDGGLIGPLT